MIRFKTLAQFHRYRGLPQPVHPLISVINLADINLKDQPEPDHMVFDFYMIGLKHDFNARVKYGQQSFDFDGSGMSFQSPGQVMRIEPKIDIPLKPSGWLLMIHPDFLWNTPLASKIRQYDFFDYAVNEALFLSDSEEVTMNRLIMDIHTELHLNIDRLSHDIIIAHIEVLLAYSERFYQRQFLTRRISSNQLLDRLNHLLDEYFQEGAALPTVAEIAGQLHVSPHYLSSMLRALTGLNTQQHIHEKLISKAKELLSTTELSIGEIAYALGFEHVPSFSKLFKSKTKISPMAFRQSFN